MNSALEVALVSASISAIVAVCVAIISPWFTHRLWMRQKRKEQQVAISSRYATLLDQIILSGQLRRTAIDVEFHGILFLIQVVFESSDVKDRARKLATGGESPDMDRIQAELMAYLFAEAHDLSFKTIPKLK
jgi:hypothetical protein